MLMLGKLLNGFMTGAIQIAALKYIHETVPNHITGMIGVSPAFGLALGDVLILLLSLEKISYNPLADQNKIWDGEVKDKLKVNQSWRIIYMIPGAVNVLMLLLFTAFIRKEPIMYSLTHSNPENATKLMDQVYD